MIRTINTFTLLLLVATMVLFENGEFLAGTVGMALAVLTARIGDTLERGEVHVLIGADHR